MTEISRVALFGKLNTVCYKGIESATVFCKMRGNPYVELVHWLHQILQLQDSDLHKIIRQFNLDPSRLAKDFTDALDRSAQRLYAPFPIYPRILKMPLNAAGYLVR